MNAGNVRTNSLKLRLFALFLTLCMVFGLDGVQIFAQEVADYTAELAAVEAETDPSGTDPSDTDPAQPEETETGDETGSGDDASAETETDIGNGNGDNYFGDDGFGGDDYFGNDAFYSDGDVPSPVDDDPAEETAGLRDFADNLLRGETDLITYTFLQSPEGAADGSAFVQEGDTLSFTLQFLFHTNNNDMYKFTDFTSPNKAIFDAYKDVTVTIVLPDGVCFDSAENVNGVTISKNEAGKNIIILDIGTIDAAGDKNLGISVKATIGRDPVTKERITLPTGQEFDIDELDVICSAKIEVIDRDRDDSILDTYTINESPSYIVPSRRLISKTDDSWAVSKSLPDIRKESVGGTNYVVFVYDVAVIMNGKSQWSEYTIDGRAKFKEFSVKESPLIKTASGDMISPLKVVITPNNFDGAPAEGTTEAEI